MLVTLNDVAAKDVCQEVNTDHVVNVATPNVNNPDHVTISLSNGRQITTNAAGAKAIRDAINNPPMTMVTGEDPSRFTSTPQIEPARTEPKKEPKRPAPMTSVTGEGQQVAG